MNKHPEYKSERREQARDRQRFQMRTNGRPEYLRLQVGRILRVRRNPDMLTAARFARCDCRFYGQGLYSSDHQTGCPAKFERGSR